MIKYSIEPKSRADLRKLANELRNILGLQNILWIPIVEILDVLPDIFPDFSYEIVEDTEMPASIHAETDIKTGHIRIKESVYNRACNGEGRDRMTIAHEIGHYFTICYCDFKIYCNYAEGNIPSYRDPEWQAKCFAGEFMVSKKLTKNMTPREISISCGVSIDAAKIQYDCN